MTHDQFCEIMHDLQVRHPNHFTAYVNADIYKIIGHLNYHQGKEIVGRLMNESRFAPVAKEFRDAVHEMMRPKTYATPIDEKPSESKLTKEEQDELWAFTKRCAAGEVGDEERLATLDAINELIRIRHNKKPPAGAKG